jgi:hypothetical protein
MRFTLTHGKILTPIGSMVNSRIQISHANADHKIGRCLELRSLRREVKAIASVATPPAGTISETAAIEICWLKYKQPKHPVYGYRSFTH